MTEILLKGRKTLTHPSILYALCHYTFDWMTDEDEIGIAMHDHHHPRIQQLMVSLYQWLLELRYI